MNKQTQFLTTLTMLSVAVKSYANSDCASYWTATIEKAMGLTIKSGSKGGDVQSTLTNPLAYYAVPLYEWNCYNAGLRNTTPKGRSVDFTMAQFVRALKSGQTSRADKIARLAADITIAEMAAVTKMVQEGYAIASLKRSSGNKEFRGNLNRQSQLARQLREIPDISQDIKEVGFE